MKDRCLISLAFLLAWCFTPTAVADGGQILLHQTSGSFAITVFATPQPLTSGDADLSVLVQDGASQQPVLDVDVSLRLQPPSGPIVPVALNQQSSQLMRSAEYHFAQPGHWGLTVEVSRGSLRSVVTGGFDVAASHSRQVLVWIFVLLPLLFIGLFAVQQHLKSQHVPRRDS